MPMKRELYPDDWNEVAKRVKDAAHWCCQSCFLQCRRPGETFDTHKRTLTVAHLDHDPANCSDENLKAMCAPGHTADVWNPDFCADCGDAVGEPGSHAALKARVAELEAALVLLADLWPRPGGVTLFCGHPPATYVVAVGGGQYAGETPDAAIRAAMEGDAE